MIPAPPATRSITTPVRLGSTHTLRTIQRTRSGGKNTTVARSMNQGKIPIPKR